MKRNRRKFIQDSSRAAVALGLLGLGACGRGEGTGDVEKVVDTTTGAMSDPAKAMFFNISLAEWSLHKRLFANEMDNLDFAKVTREEFDLGGIEYVNAFFKDKAKDMDYLKQLNQRAADYDVRQLLIMIDGEGGLGDTNETARKQAVENHFKWVDAAKFLGCHSIRVNAYGEGTAEEVADAATKSLAALAKYGQTDNINVIVENHGGYSSNGDWLASVMRNVNMDNCGTLPDFGNFCIKKTDEPKYEDRTCIDEYDRYKGVQQLMPFAKAVSAKSHDFGDDGLETNTDYRRMMKIVQQAGYDGWVGIEYEGGGLSEPEGILATRDLLRRVGRELS